MKIRIAVALALALVTTAARADSTPPLGWPVTPPSTSPVTKIGTLNHATPILTFKGAVNNHTPLPLVNPTFAPPVCTITCREYSFTAATTEPFIAAIHSDRSPTRTGSFNPNDGFDLYVYGPDQRLQAAANGIGADGQSLEITKPSKGIYTLVVTFTFAQDPDAALHGEVRLMSAPTWQPAPCTHTTIGGVTGCFNLPTLRALPGYDVAVSGLPPIASTPLGFPLPLLPGTPTSCYIDETLGLTNPAIPPQPANITRCLRFTSDVQNVGAGAMEVRLPWLTSSGTSGFIPGGCHAEQVVTTVDGRQAVRPAGDCLFHLAHAHFHYKDLISYTLYRHGANGPGSKVGTSQKASFCLADDEYFGYGTPGPNGQRDFVGQPGCNIPETVGNSLYVFEGITPGWGDVYTWDTPDQFIDISNVPPGDYDLVMETNPHGSLLVAGPQQTCALTPVHLTASAVSAGKPVASIPCPS
jgi:hypothetical protein